MGCRSIVGSKKDAPSSFTSADLANVLGIEPGEASAWLGKLRRWGYVVSAGSTPSEVVKKGGRHAWFRLYELTEKGESKSVRLAECPECHYKAPKRDFFE